jgi:nucleotidyltransferase substrate binding protein (TIGR01987 family)
MKLDLSSLRNAIGQLEDALELSSSDLAKSNAKLALHLRAAAIQAFEFTYELSIKMLKRYLETAEPNPGAVQEMSFNELVRRAYATGLLNAELVEWKIFRKNRGTTSHTYDSSKAQEVYEAIPAFLREAKFILAQIEQRQEQEF